MNKWENKNNYLISLEELHLKAKNKVIKIPKFGKGYYTQDKLDIVNNANEAYLMTIKEELCDDIFENIKYFKLNLNLLDILVIMSIKKEIDFFKKGKHSTDATRLRDQILSLKRTADRTAIYNYFETIIKLPILPQVSLSLMCKYFQDRGENKETVDNIHTFFIDNVPRKIRDDLDEANAIMITIDEIVDEVLKSDNHDTLTKISQMTIDKISDKVKYECKVAGLKS